MLNQFCALCRKNNFTVLYKQNFNINKFDETLFSARRLPDRIHYRIVRCNQCGLIYSHPILSPGLIEKLYKKSSVNYDDQISYLKKNYGNYLCQLGKYHPVKNRLLEIGCGNGFFLEVALDQGYKQVYGVEPGKKSVSKAGRLVRDKIINDIFKPGLYPKNYFDVICCFQTFDHIIDPNRFLAECFRILRPGGLTLFLNHDSASLTAKLLKERSPIIDIEHTYLYNHETMTKIFQKHRFQVICVKNAGSVYPLSYWLYLLPIPKIIKFTCQKILKSIRLEKIGLPLYPGNLVLFAKKQ